MAKSMVVLAAIGISVLAPGATAYMPAFKDSTDSEVLACDIQEIRSEISAQQVSYKASGFCKRLRQSQVRQQGASTFDNFDRNATELYRFNWTSVGAFNPTTKSTFEEISAPPPRIDEVAPAGRPYGRHLREMVCDKDPWLDQTSRCTAPRVTATGVLTEQDKKVLGYSNQPFTAFLKPEQRQALRDAQRQFDERQAMLNRIGNQQLSSATSTTRAGATTAPTAGALGSAGSRTATVQGATAAPAAVTPPAGTSGTDTGTVSAALRLQAALEAQRRAQAAGQATPAPSAATPSSPAAPTPAPSNAAPTPTPTPSPTAMPAPAASPAASVASTATAAPRVTLPSANSQVRQGQLRVQVALSGAGASRAADVEFTPVVTSAGATTDSSAARLQWTVPIDQLAAGVPVPAASGPRSSGRWQMRVRLAGGASAWSEPVVFDYVAVAGNEWKGGKAWGHANQLDRQGLNPQPLPPKEAAAASQLEQQGLNPQPLPPKEAARASTQIDQRALNPQPLPPKDPAAASELEQRGLNPQPLPPKESLRAPTQLDQRALNPQPLPPKEAKKFSPYERQTLNPQPLPPKEVTTPASSFQR